MLTRTQYDFCSDFYYLEQTVEAVINRGDDERHFRIEALRDDRDRFVAHVLVRKQFMLQPAHQKEGGPGQGPEEVSLWVDFPHFAEADGTTADEAIANALHWLRQ
jgi:hypothetical protein